MLLELVILTCTAVVVENNYGDNYYFHFDPGISVASLCHKVRPLLAKHKRSGCLKW